MPISTNVVPFLSVDSLPDAFPDRCPDAFPDRCPDDLVWMGDGLCPSDAEVERAVQVLAAVPLAGAAGWSVRGHPWSSHARRLRTAVVRPSGDWQISWMRGVREVDCLSGPVLVRRRHLDRLDAEAEGPAGPVQVMSRTMRASGFRLLLLGQQ